MALSGQVGVGYIGSHPLGNINQFHGITPSAKVGACLHGCFRCRLSRAVCTSADSLGPSLPSLGDICADAKPEPLIEPGNATAIGQGHRHITGPLQVRQHSTHTLGRNPAPAICRVRDDI